MFQFSRLSVLLRSLVPQPVVQTPAATFYKWARFRTRANKHWSPRWKAIRKAKVIKVELHDFYEDETPPDQLTPDQIRAKMKERGLQPPHTWQERQIDVSSTGGIFEPYVPPEGDGKMSLVSVGGAKQVARRLEKKSKTYLTVRKIRKYDEDFDFELFIPDALKIYQNLHTAMATIPIDKDNIISLVTERAYPEVMDNLDCKSIKWSYIEAIEPPRVVHGRQTYLVQKDNIFAQLTVRFHSKQVLAVYDRFGRLCHGNPLTAKDVLEYVVFEKHLSDEYGIWRIHAKIIPEWMHVPPQDRRTLKLNREKPPKPETVPPKSIESSSTPVIAPSNERSSSSTPQLQPA